MLIKYNNESISVNITVVICSWAGVICMDLPTSMGPSRQIKIDYKKYMVK